MRLALQPLPSTMAPLTVTTLMSRMLALQLMLGSRDGCWSTPCLASHSWAFLGTGPEGPELGCLLQLVSSQVRRRQPETYGISPLNP